jgi:eukaryotic-like serine/threonine-protein kinase
LKRHLQACHGDSRPDPFGPNPASQAHAFPHLLLITTNPAQPNEATPRLFGSPGRGVDKNVPWKSSTTVPRVSAAVHLRTGSRLGPYEVDGLIASGGMGDVYRACDTRLNRKVALKVLAPSVTTDAERLARFAQEARTTALLNHPNIVAIYDVGADNGVPFVVSELLRGETLRARLKDGALPVGVSVSYAVEVARGLTAAHYLGVVHRDLKPENIFITEDERVKILDFGLAKCRNETLGIPQQDSSVSTQPGTLLGTVGYMSPEQVRGVSTDERSDIFSLGVILHEMISGNAPFHGDSAIETLHAILKDDAPVLPDREGISAELEHVIRHCLEKSSDARFQSARDLAFVLEFVLRSPQRPQPRTRPARRLLQSIFELVF